MNAQLQVDSHPDMTVDIARIKNNKQPQNKPNLGLFLNWVAVKIALTTILH